MRTAMAVQPKPAATVVLLRDGHSGPEVLLLKRTARTQFGPGAFVFPGGAVDDSDHGVPCPLDDATASAELGIASGGLAYRHAAIRECFEEAGILLAYDAGGQPLNLEPAQARSRFATYRDALRNQEMTLRELCLRERLTVYGEQMLYASHWITPAYSPKRYDTRFFLAVAPPGQQAQCCGEETVEQCWLTPELALAAMRAGTMDLMTPTRDTLERLRPFSNTRGIVAELASESRGGSNIPGHGLMEQRFPDPAHW